jgi:hypothetical protein
MWVKDNNGLASAYYIGYGGRYTNGFNSMKTLQQNGGGSGGTREDDGELEDNDNNNND